MAHAKWVIKPSNRLKVWRDTAPDDLTLERVQLAADGTRFQASEKVLTAIISGDYGVSASNLVQQFVTSRGTQQRQEITDDDRDIVQVWRDRLHLAREKSRARSVGGKIILPADRHENIKRVIADVCFLKFVYDDVSAEPSSADLSAAVQHANMVEKIIDKHELAHEAIDAVELLLLFTVF